jgi:hypothetical protein
MNQFYKLRLFPIFLLQWLAQGSGLDENEISMASEMGPHGNSSHLGYSHCKRSQAQSLLRASAGLPRLATFLFLTVKKVKS